MTTIRRASWKDLLRPSAFDLGTNDEVIMPPSSIRGPYTLVALSPGNQVIGFLGTNVLEGGDTSAKSVSIDKCLSNRLYPTLEPLVCRMEEILKWGKVFSIEVDIPLSCTDEAVYSKLGYVPVTSSRRRKKMLVTEEEENVVTLQEEEKVLTLQEKIVTTEDEVVGKQLFSRALFSLKSVGNGAGHQLSSEKKVEAEKLMGLVQTVLQNVTLNNVEVMTKAEAEAEAEAEASTSAPALPSQAQRRQRGRRAS